MEISYKKLWHILLDRGIKKKDLAEMAQISDFTIRKLNHGGNVTVDILGRICVALGCSLDDICEIISENNRRDGGHYEK